MDSMSWVASGSTRESWRRRRVKCFWLLEGDISWSSRSSVFRFNFRHICTLPLNTIVITLASDPSYSSLLVAHPGASCREQLLKSVVFRTPIVYSPMDVQGNRPRRPKALSSITITQRLTTSSQIEKKAPWICLLCLRSEQYGWACGMC